MVRFQGQEKIKLGGTTTMATRTALYFKKQEDETARTHKTHFGFMCTRRFVLLLLEVECSPCRHRRRPSQFYFFLSLKPYHLCLPPTLALICTTSIAPSDTSRRRRRRAVSTES